MKLSTTQDYLVLNDDISWNPVMWFSKIPNTPDMSFPKKAIYEIFDYLNMSKFIDSLIWVDKISTDCIYHYLPIISWKNHSKMTDNEYTYRNDITDALIFILCKKWNKTVDIQ